MGSWGEFSGLTVACAPSVTECLTFVPMKDKYPKLSVRVSAQLKASCDKAGPKAVREVLEAAFPPPPPVNYDDPNAIAESLVALIASMRGEAEDGGPEQARY